MFGVLKQVLNLSINQGIFLENIKNACVTPIFKGGDKNLLTTYRSIPHFVKSVYIRSYSGPYFPAFGLNKLSVFSPNAGKYGPE